jgi:hypothetical protein
MEGDTIRIEVLKDGSLKLTTDAVSDANHYAAEELLKALQQRAGGSTTVENRHPDGVEHEHRHEHGHTHGGSHHHHN